SCVVATSILILFGLYNIFNGESVNILLFHNFPLLFDQHPVYFALYLTLSIFSLTYYFHKIDELVIGKKIVLISSLSILISGLILTVSKSVIFIFFILYPLFFLFLKKRVKTKILICFSFLVVGLIVFNFPAVKERFKDGLEFNIKNFQPTNNLVEAKVFEHQDKVEISDLELRYIFWKIGFFHFINEGKFLFGYRNGDVQDYLDYYYLMYGLAPNWYEGYNIHNQYLHTLITYGVFVFLLFCLYLGLSFYYAFKYKNLLHQLFLITVCFIFVFEVILVRN